MSVEVLEQAARMADAAVSSLPSVWATVHGEHSAAIAILGMMHKGEGKVSPTRFHNSVHNTASGYASIATANELPSTTLTGGGEIVPSAFIEAACLLEDQQRNVALVLADEPLQFPFERADAPHGLALAWVLSGQREGAFACIRDIQREKAEPLSQSSYFGSLHVSAALPLLEAIVKERAGNVALEFTADDTGSVWRAELEILAPFPGSHASACTGRF